MTLPRPAGDRALESAQGRELLFPPGATATPPAQAPHAAALPHHDPQLHPLQHSTPPAADTSPHQEQQQQQQQPDAPAPPPGHAASDAALQEHARLPLPVNAALEPLHISDPTDSPSYGGTIAPDSGPDPSGSEPDAPDMPDGSAESDPAADAELGQLDSQAPFPAPPAAAGQEAASQLSAGSDAADVSPGAKAQGGPWFCLTTAPPTQVSPGCTVGKVSCLCRCLMSVGLMEVKV